MQVQVFKGYEGDSHVPNGIREIHDIYVECDICGYDLDINEHVYECVQGYCCSKCFLKIHQKHTISELIEKGEIKVEEL